MDKQQQEEAIRHLSLVFHKETQKTVLSDSFNNYKQVSFLPGASC